MMTWLHLTEHSRVSGLVSPAPDVGTKRDPRGISGSCVGDAQARTGSLRRLSCSGYGRCRMSQTSISFLMAPRRDGMRSAATLSPAAALGPRE